MTPARNPAIYTEWIYRCIIFIQTEIRSIFGPTVKEVTRKWKKNIIRPDARKIKVRRLRLAEYVKSMEEKRYTRRISTERHKEQRPLGRPRRGRENNIKVDLKHNVSLGLASSKLRTQSYVDLL